MSKNETMELIYEKINKLIEINKPYEYKDYENYLDSEIIYKTKPHKISYLLTLNTKLDLLDEGRYRVNHLANQTFESYNLICEIKEQLDLFETKQLYMTKTEYYDLLKKSLYNETEFDTELFWYIYNLVEICEAHINVLSDYCDYKSNFTHGFIDKTEIKKMTRLISPE